MRPAGTIGRRSRGYDIARSRVGPFDAGSADRPSAQSFGQATGYGNGWTEQRVRGFRKHHEIEVYRDGEWAERGEITLDAAAQIIGVAKMTALRMIRRGDVKGRQVCKGAPWVIKAEDVAASCRPEAISRSGNTKSCAADL